MVASLSLMCPLISCMRTKHHQPYLVKTMQQSTIRQTAFILYSCIWLIDGYIDSCFQFLYTVWMSYFVLALLLRRTVVVFYCILQSYSGTKKWDYIFFLFCSDKEPYFEHKTRTYERTRPTMMACDARMQYAKRAHLARHHGKSSSSFLRTILVPRVRPQAGSSPTMCSLVHRALRWCQRF